MPKVALADTVLDWQQLLLAAAPYRDREHMRVRLDGLQGSLDQLRELDAVRAELEARRQETTQRINEIREAGKLLAIEIRTLIRGDLGHDNERLVQYRMKPRRRKSGRSVPPPSTPLPTPE